MKKQISLILGVITLMIMFCSNAFAQTSLHIKVFKANHINDLMNVVCAETGSLVTCINGKDGKLSSGDAEYAWLYFQNFVKEKVNIEFSSEQINNFQKENNLTEDQTYDKLFIKYYQDYRNSIKNPVGVSAKKQWTKTNTTTDLSKCSRINMDMISKDSLVWKAYQNK